MPWVLKGGLSVGLISWVLSKVDLASAWAQAKAIDPWMLVAAIGLMIVQIGLGAVRWGMVLRVLGAAFSWAQTVAVYYIGVFFSLVLPGAVGGDAVRMWFSRKAGLPLHTAVNSVMLERAVTVYGLVLLVCVTQPILQARVPELPGGWIFQALLAIATVGILALSVMDRLPESLGHLRVVRGLAQLAADTRALFFRPFKAAATLAVAMAGHANLSMAVYLLAIGLNLDIHALDCLVLVPPVILAMTLPISIAGWGVRETAMVTAFGFVGLAPEAALVLSVVFGVVTMATALPGGLVFLLSGTRIPVEEMEAEVEAEEEAERETASANP
ncbi:MAG TPA: lysylphosphatidylglycerol synthase transmembrane domain-containing protein [Candidatus Omnitrophota bacterium]|nr:lysylphosphatidylglycerol synthase transmembrane domain-containing protein [Candidatus Omnitrophota bacterium]